MNSLITNSLVPAGVLVRQQNRLRRSAPPARSPRALRQLCRASLESSSNAVSTNDDMPAIARRSLLSGFVTAPSLLFAEVQKASAASGNGKNVIITGCAVYARMNDPVQISI